MAKSKNNVKTYKFTSTQSDWLKRFITGYISAEDADPDDVSGAVTKFVEDAYKELVAKYDMEEEAQKDLIALAKWLQSKAKSTRKKNRLHAQLEMTARRLYHQDNWKELLKPKVVSRMKKKYPQGPHTSKHPKWLKVMQRVEARMWDVLTKEEQQEYEKRAADLNSGQESKQAKAQYAEAHFRQGMQKVLNDVGKVFGVRIIAVGVRPGPGGQFLVSVHEDDGGAKFIKTVRKDALFRWTPKDYMKFLKVPKSAVELKLADEGRDYQLIYDNHGVPELPSITANPYITHWRKPFAEYMQYHWKQATGRKKTPYKAINENPEQYMEMKYLPPNRDAKFTIMKPNEMKFEHLETWIEHIYARQVLKKDGRLAGPIFEFKKPSLATKGGSSGKKRAKKRKSTDRPSATANGASDERISSDEEEYNVDAVLAASDRDGSEGEVQKELEHQEEKQSDDEEEVDEELVRLEGKVTGEPVTFRSARKNEQSQVDQEEEVGSRNATKAKHSTPKTSAPKSQADKTSAPKSQADKTSAPKSKASKTSAPKSNAKKTPAPKSKANKTSAAKSQTHKTSAQQSLTEDPRAVTTEDSTPRGLDAGTDTSHVDIEEGAPASVDDKWQARVAFLNSLSSFGPYLKLVEMLARRETTIAAPPNTGFGCLPWADWSSTKRWLPVEVHTTTFARDAIQYYLEDWEKACAEESHRPLGPHLHHFLLVSGLLYRDITEAHFSLQDPDDADILPDHVLATQFGLDFTLPIERVINVVYQSMTRTSKTTPNSTPDSNSIPSPVKKGGRKAVPKGQGPKPGKRPHEDSNDDGAKPSKRRVTSKPGIPRPDAFSQSFEEGGVFADSVPEQRHSNRLQGKGRTMYLKSGELVRGGQ